MPIFPVNSTAAQRPDLRNTELTESGSSTNNINQSLPTKSLASRLAKGVVNAALDQLRITYGSPSRNFYCYRETKSLTFSIDKNLKDKARTYPDAVEIKLWGDESYRYGVAATCSSAWLKDILLFKNLRKITLEGRHWNDDHLEVLSKHPNLCEVCINLEYFRFYPTRDMDENRYYARITLYQGNMTDRGIQALTNNRNISTLDLTDYRNLTDVGVRDLGALKKLQILNLTNTPSITNEGLMGLQPIPDLRVLMLNKFNDHGSFRPQSGRVESHFNGIAIQTISTHKNLQQLSLANCIYITDHDLGKIAENFRWLNKLNLEGCGSITKTGLVNLQTMQHLSAISLSNTKIDDQGVAMLLRLPRLRSIILSHCDNLTPNVIDSLSQMNHLSYLDIGKCRKVNKYNIHHQLRKKFKDIQFPIERND